jgi:hypothetical protein
VTPPDPTRSWWLMPITSPARQSEGTRQTNVLWRGTPGAASHRAWLYNETTMPYNDCYGFYYCHGQS